MRDWFAGGLLAVGTLVVIASAIRATRAWLRYVRSRKETLGDSRASGLAGVELAHSNGWNGALLAVGLEVFVAGAVIDRSMDSSDLWIPFAFFVASAFAALVMRRTRAQLLNSDPGRPAPLR